MSLRTSLRVREEVGSAVATVPADAATWAEVVAAPTSVGAEAVATRYNNVVNSYDLGPVKAAIGWVRLVAPSDVAPTSRYVVEKMSYEDYEIDDNPAVIINATSEPCGIELTTNDFKEWTITVGGSFHSTHKDIKWGKSAWRQARQAIIDMTVLDWMAML